MSEELKDEWEKLMILVSALSTDISLLTVEQIRKARLALLPQPPKLIRQNAMVVRNPKRLSFA
jgi:hypothetical protein